MTRTLDSEPESAPSRLAHVVLRVPDLKRSIAWYCEVVGMEVVQAVGPIAFLTFDSEHHRLALIETPVSSNDEPGAPGLDHIAFAVDSLGQLLATYRSLVPFQFTQRLQGVERDLRSLRQPRIGRSVLRARTARQLDSP